MWGRLVFGSQLPASSKKEKGVLPGKSQKGNGGRDDNSKSELQTFLVRARHRVPIYKTISLKIKKFRSTVILNGLDLVGQPCSSKKEAEKDAVVEVLLWLKGEIHASVTKILIGVE